MESASTPPWTGAILRHAQKNLPNIPVQAAPVPLPPEAPGLGRFGCHGEQPQCPSALTFAKRPVHPLELRRTTVIRCERTEASVILNAT